MKRLGPILLAAACLLLAAGSLVLRLHGPLFISPDETAAHFFASAYATSSNLAVPVPLSDTVGDVLYPRSMLSVAGALVPSGFLGLPLMLGVAAKLFGAASIPFLPIALSVLGVLAWTLVFRRLFGERAGWIAGVMLAVQPAWWYYTARSLMPNVPFLAFVGFALMFLLVRPFAKWNKHPAFDGLMAGACVGAALFIRASEALWLGMILLALLIWLRRTLGRNVLAAFAVGAVLVLSPLPLLQKDLYGSPWATGYTAVQEVSGGEASIAPSWPVVSTSTWWQKIEGTLKPAFPFGIHPRLAARQFAAYGLGMFWWEFLLVAFGIWQLAAGRKKVFSGSDLNYQLPTANYLILCAVVTLWLALMYGSWTFTDNPDPTQITIGNSHVRYWLPILVLWLPFAAVALDELAARAKKLAAAALIGGWIIWAALGFNVAFLSPQDGLLAETRVLDQSQIIHDAVMKLVPENGVIVVDRADKIFFPDRLVRYPLRDDKTYALIPQIAYRVPTYYYGITLPPQDLAYVNDVKLAGTPFKFLPVQAFGIETLYRVFDMTSSVAPF